MSHTAAGGDFTLQCPIPIADYPQVLLAHGGGGRLMNQLIERIFLTAFANPLLEARHDGAVFSLSARAGRLHHRLLRGAAALLPGR